MTDKQRLIVVVGCIVIGVTALAASLVFAPDRTGKPAPSARTSPVAGTVSGTTPPGGAH